MQFFPLKGLKKHTYNAFSDVFPRTWRIYQRRKISVFRLIWKELCGQMANLVAESEGNKGKKAKNFTS
jgi:hypothetical protein